MQTHSTHTLSLERPLQSPHQSNRTPSAEGSVDCGGATPSGRDGGHWGRAGCASSSEERRELNKELERKMQEELSAMKRQGKDVDRLVMKALMARVRDSGPNTAFKALASIEVCAVRAVNTMTV